MVDNVKTASEKTLSICTFYRHDILIFGVNFAMIYVWIKSDHIETQKKRSDYSDPHARSIIHRRDRSIKTFQMRGVRKDITTFLVGFIKTFQMKSELLTTNYHLCKSSFRKEWADIFWTYAKKEKTKKKLDKTEIISFFYQETCVRSSCL